jgi:hypothetical protein
LQKALPDTDERTAEKVEAYAKIKAKFLGGNDTLPTHAILYDECNAR